MAVAFFLIANRDQIISKRVVDGSLSGNTAHGIYLQIVAQQLYVMRDAEPSVGSQSPNLQCGCPSYGYMGKLQVIVRLAFLMMVEVHLPVGFCVPFTLLDSNTVDDRRRHILCFVYSFRVRGWKK